MRALVITGPRAVAFCDVPEPAPGAGEVLLRVRWVGFCGSDLNTFRGLNPLVSYPRIPGHEVSGVIEAVGAGVPTPWRPGLAVTLSPYTECGVCAACRRGRPNACRDNQTLGVQRDGALTEYLVVPWGRLFEAPGLDLQALALVEPVSIGVHAADRGQVAAGETVCVLGCGPVGLGAVAAAAARGARVIAVDIDDAKLELAVRSGAVFPVNSARQDLHAALQGLTAGHGPDVVIEAIGLPATFAGAVAEVAFTGRVVYIGYARQPVEYQTKLFVQKELDIRGSRNALPADFAAAIGLLREGRLPPRAMVTRVYPFAEAGRALADWDRTPAAVTRILVDVGNAQCRG